MSENLIDVRINDVRNLLAHYDNDRDGLLSYKEFLDMVLPKEHPDLRAFVTQRECFEISDKEFLSYETEAAMAILLALEIGIFEGAIFEKMELDRLVVSGHKIVTMIDGNEKGNLNFNNIQRFLHECGLMPYDSEIINFLRRIDRDDDGVISGDELCDFLGKFTAIFEDRSPLRSMQLKQENGTIVNFSPSNKYTMISTVPSQLALQIHKPMAQNTSSSQVKYIHKASPSHIVRSGHIQPSLVSSRVTIHQSQVTPKENIPSLGFAKEN